MTSARSLPGCVPAATTPAAEPSVPRDRPFYAVDAYYEVQHVEWIGEQGAPFGPYVGILDSDGGAFPVGDILAWSEDKSEAERMAGA